MRNTSRQSLNAVVALLADAKPDADAARDLFAVARVLGGSTQLLSALADATADQQQKKTLVDRVFGDALAPTGDTLLKALVSGRWSEHEDLIAGLEEVAVRASARAAKKPGTIEGDLFAFNDVVASDPDLELALRNKLARPEAKEALVTQLLADKVDEATTTIIRHLVTAPGAGRLRDSLRRAAQIVADESGAIVATVTSAAPLEPKQHDELVSTLSERYGRTVTVNSRVEPEILGGIRVEVGDEVIDGSVASRLAEVQQRLAG